MTSGPNQLPRSLASFLREDPVPLDARSLDRTLVLAPHPDDESLGCGGTLALLRKAGYPVHVVFISDGALSHPNSPSYPPERLRDLRETEAIRALDVLGIPAKETTFMRLPDRHVPLPGNAGFDEAVSSLLAVIQQFNPTTVVVPYERDPHPDHRATYALLQAAVGRLSTEERPRVLEYLIWLWELGRPDDLPKPGERLVLQVAIDAVVAQKKRAIDAHQSQVTRLIDDDPTAFYLSPELLSHFDTPYELFVEKLLL